MLKVSPSILACDFCRMAQEIAAIEKTDADMLHLDIMDGHFVPNISFGPPVVTSLRNESAMLFDVHLMLTHPLAYIDAFADAGADIITFHLESESDTAQTIRAIKARGKKCGLALKPKTAVEALVPFLTELDMVLVMTVEPGFGGQDFLPGMLPKIEQVRGLADKLRLPLDIQVDGGIDSDTAPLAGRAGANVLVAGSSIFSAHDYADAVNRLRFAVG